MIPDIEKIVGAYLRDHDDIAALGAQVVGQTPRDTSGSWVRLTLLAAPDNSSGAEHLIGFLVQLDCYSSEAGIDGSQQKEASVLGRTVRAALKAMQGTTRDDAVITGVQFPGMLRLLDQDLESARERIVLTATIWAHAA